MWWDRFFKNNPNRRVCEEFEVMHGIYDSGVAAPRFLGGRLDGFLAWSKEFATSPHDMGAVIPSGPVLGKCMAQQVSLNDDGLVIELGAGTGTMTHALLKRGINPERLVVIERSEILANYLSRRFPEVRVVRGDAARLGIILGARPYSVSTIISSLPLHALPQNTVKEISAQLDEVSHEGTRYIQFTFHRTSGWSLNKNFKQVYSERVWANIPPARVEVFVYNKRC